MGQSFKSSAGLASTPQHQREPSWDEAIDWFQTPDDDEVHLYRLVGAPFYYAQHWIQTIKKDGKMGKSYPVVCSNYDSKTNTWAENGCEVCEWMRQTNDVFRAANERLEKEGQKKLEWNTALPAWVRKSAKRITMATNVIIRELQEQGPPSNNPTGWSFIRQLRFPQGFSATLKEQQEKYNKRNGQVYALNDIAEGPDLEISYNSQAADIKNMYSLRVGRDATPITEEELTHENFLVDFASHLTYPKQADVADSLRRNKYYDWLNDFKNSQPSESIQKSAPPTQAQQPPAQTQGRQGAGRFAASGIPEAPFEDTGEPEPAASSGIAIGHGASASNGSIAIGNGAVAGHSGPTITGSHNNIAVGSNSTATQNNGQHTPAQQVAPAPAPAQPAPVQAAPAAAPKAPTTDRGAGVPASKAAPIENRLQEFSGKFGAALVPTNKAYEGKTLRLYRPDLAVPDCWSTYTKKVSENKDQCRGCPLRLDCMMVTA